MARLVLVLSGEVGAGKSTLADNLRERYGAERISTHVLLVGRLGDSAVEERGTLQEAGERLDTRTRGAWVRDEAQSRIEAMKDDAIVVIDSIRVKGQLDALRQSYGRLVVHLHLHAPLDVLRKRYKARARTPKFKEFASYDQVLKNWTEAQVDTLKDDADVVIDTAQCTPADVVVRAACHLGLHSRDTEPLVDVVVGGEYGSEGKGNVCFYLAPEYDLLVRVGGPNAGHMVPRSEGEPFKHQLLPSGTWSAPNAKLLIGPGAVLDLDILLTEIAKCNIDDFARLSIDPQAMILTQADKYAERRVVRDISSTGSGTGEATARRIRGRGKKTGRKVKLACDIPALEPYCGRPAADILEETFASGQRVMLEGTQGTMLSLYHGEYPFVTSRDTTAAGCLAEAGIAPRHVRKVILVCRTYPIRVGDPPGGTSGYMSQPLDWTIIAKRAGLSLRALKKQEVGTVSGKPRRVAEFDWALLRKAALLNAPSDIALTFVDYLDARNSDARRLDQLQPDTIRFIEEVERVTSAPVSLISTRFHPRSIIDRRNW
jgi:adenylosuccinate synthase